MTKEEKYRRIPEKLKWNLAEQRFKTNTPSHANDVYDAIFTYKNRKYFTYIL